MMRIIYLGYYIYKMNWPLLKKFYKHTLKNSKYNFFSLIIDNIYSVFKYNISILEFFQFKFFEKNHQERSLWAGTGFMYDSIKILNPEKERYKLNDKIFFLSYYTPFIKHSFISLKSLKSDSFNFDINQKLVLKNSTGQCGRGVEVINAEGITKEALISRLEIKNNDLVEEFIYQHDDLKKMSPSGLNTLRIFTTLNAKDEVDILGVRLRISINSIVDNMAAGNVAAAVDEDTGIVNGPGVYSDITKKPEFTHPITGVDIIGFKIPFFKESLQLAKDAALFDKGNRSVGWDVAISNTGASLIEGNHDWCKLVWQLPVEQGLKNILESYVK